MKNSLKPVCVILVNQSMNIPIFSKDGSLPFPVVGFSQDFVLKTLMITNFDFEYGPKYWNDIQVVGAIKPTGRVGICDVITDCVGSVIVIHHNTTYLGKGVWEFYLKDN